MKLKNETSDKNNELKLEKLKWFLQMVYKMLPMRKEHFQTIKPYIWSIYGFVFVLF